MRTVYIQDEYDMISFGRALGALLPGEVVVGLSGGLGAGKTTLTKGISMGIGIMEPVTSPTYSIMNEYEGLPRRLYHLDLYRINTTREIDELELESLLSPRSNIIIEWIEKLDAKWLDNLIHITVSYDIERPDNDNKGRKLEIEASNDELKQVIEKAVMKFETKY